MVSLRVFALAACLLSLVSLVLPACSKDSGTNDGGDDSISDYDASDSPIGPLVCGVPMATACPSSAPCTFAGWGCASESTCDGYFVVTDGTWDYYYSSYGGALAGMISHDDGGVEACPYGFLVPGKCTAVSGTECTGDAGSLADAAFDASTESGADAYVEEAGDSGVGGGAEASAD